MNQVEPEIFVDRFGEVVEIAYNIDLPSFLILIFPHLNSENMTPKMSKNESTRDLSS